MVGPQIGHPEMNMIIFKHFFLNLYYIFMIYHIIKVGIANIPIRI